MKFVRLFAASVCVIFGALPGRAAIQSYAVDAATLHLWHLDDAATPCIDAAPDGTNLTYAINGAVVASSSFSTNGINFGNCISFGTLATPGAVIFPVGTGNVGAVAPFTYAGTNGAFTFEALVQIEFNTTNFFRSQPCQIINCDADNTGTRVFQWRLDPVGVAVGGSDTNFVRIEFINGTTTVAIAPIPTNGPDLIVSNNWYHVAVTYNGNANTTSNLLFYWTLLSPVRTNADCIYSVNMASDLPGVNTASTIFSLGNSARNPSGGSGADNSNFPGKIDEVRMSSVARAANNMVFISTNIDIVSQPSPTNQLVGQGQPFSMAVTASGVGQLNFQWRKNGNPLGGATNSIFTNTAAQLSDAGNYDVVITNNFNAVTSAVAVVTVSNLVIVTQPASVAAGFASTVTFIVTAVGAQPIAYQWRKNGVAVPGATNTMLTLGPLAAGDAAIYDVVVSNSVAVLDSAMATLTIGGPQLTYSQINDGNPAGSGFAYAGDSAINGVSFICSGLMTVSNQQFFAYYGRHQTNPAYTYNNTIWIARRSAGSNDWQVFRTTFTANDITDGHDVVAFGIDGRGYMHLSWGMHNDNLHYARSTGPVTGSQPIGFGADLGAGGMTGTEVVVTYPQFLTMPNGDLLFLYRVGGPGGGSGGGDTWLDRWSVASQTWTNVNVSNNVPFQFIKGYWSSSDNYNAYPNMPCLDAAGNLYFAWCWRETPAYESNHDLMFAKSPDGGVSWEQYNGTSYGLPISKSGEDGDPSSIAQIVMPIPQNYSLINQAGMCLDASNNPVIATWWAPGSGTNNFQRQYMVVFPDTNGVWQTRQISTRTNDPPGTMMLDPVVRDLGRPVAVSDRQNRLIVLYRDNFGSNGLTVAYTLPYAMDPLRTNWTTIDLTTDNLGNYEPVIDLARWQYDNVMDIVYQASDGEGYIAATNSASAIGVMEWNAAAYFNHHPTLQLALTNANRDVVLAWNSQAGWGYQVQWSTNLIAWNTAATLAGAGGFLPQQNVQTNTAAGPQRFWRLQTQQGGF